MGAIPVNVRFPPDQLAKLDAWIDKNHPGTSRPEAVREIVRAFMHIVDKDRG